MDTSITNRRPVPISALREKIIIDYPHWATRELLMNAVCHRTYESNSPIQFYQYDDRIEIMNPGGLYGKVNAENFPLVNDYRNPIVAEAMKVLGFVNRFSRGVMRVKEELKENKNGEPQFSLDLVTAFLVTEYISAEALRYEPIEEKSKEKDKSKEKSKEKNRGITDIERNILKIFENNPAATYSFISNNIGVSESYVYKTIKKLKVKGWIERKKGRKHGIWVVLKTIR